MTQRTSVGFGFYFATKNEPPILNSDFFRSYLQYGVWLRSLSARQQLRLIAECRNSTMERLAATANFYQQIAMQAEDICAMLITLIALQKNENVRVPDVLKRISFTASSKSDFDATPTCINQLASSGKTVRVNARQFFGNLAALSHIDLLELFGLKWSKNPSVKTVPKNMVENWQTLPMRVNNLCQSISDDGFGHLTNTFNKIKHGPQLDVIDFFKYLQNALQNDKESNARPHELIETLKRNGNHAETIRVLFDGSNVAGNSDQKVNCFFLEDNPSDLGYFFTNLNFRWQS